MNKKLAAALSGGAALLMALSGCGDDNGKKVDDYAKQICDQLQPQLKKIKDANESIASAADGEPEDVKKADSAAFQQISAAYAAMSESVENVGVPPVDNGEQIQKDVVAELDATSKAYADVKKSFDQLNAMDQAKFAEGLAGIARRIDKVSKVGDDAMEQLQSGEIGTAIAKQPGCQRPTSSPTATQS